MNPSLSRSVSHMPPSEYALHPAHTAAPSINDGAADRVIQNASASMRRCTGRSPASSDADVHPEATSATWHSRFGRALPPNTSRSNRMTYAVPYKKPGAQPNVTLDGRNSNAAPGEKDVSNQRDKSTTRAAIAQVNTHAALCARGEDCPLVAFILPTLKGASYCLRLGCSLFPAGAPNHHRPFMEGDHYLT